MKSLQKVGLVVAGLACSALSVFADFAADVETMQTDAEGYISTIQPAIVSVLMVMLGLVAVFVLYRWIKRALAGR